MKSKVIIHVGMQKTGSTWLQSQIFPKLKSHSVIQSQQFRHLMYELDPAKDFFISYENYVGYPYTVDERLLNGFTETRKKALENLANLFPGADIVLVIREHVDFIKSLYNQYIKVGGCITFREYVLGDTPYSLDRQALLFEPLIAEIKQRFDSRLLVLDYSLFRADKKKFGAILLDFIGSDDQIDFTAKGDVLLNPSLTMRQLRAQLFLNGIVANKFSNKGIRVPLKVFRATRAFSKLILSRFFHDGQIFDPVILNELSDYYSADKAYLQRILPDGHVVL